MTALVKTCRRRPYSGMTAFTLAIIIQTFEVGNIQRRTFSLFLYCVRPESGNLNCSCRRHAMIACWIDMPKSAVFFARQAATAPQGCIPCCLAGFDSDMTADDCCDIVQAGGFSHRNIIKPAAGYLPSLEQDQFIARGMRREP